MLEWSWKQNWNPRNILRKDPLKTNSDILLQIIAKVFHQFFVKPCNLWDSKSVSNKVQSFNFYEIDLVFRNLKITFFMKKMEHLFLNRIIALGIHIKRILQKELGNKISSLSRDQLLKIFSLSFFTICHDLCYTRAFENWN